MKRLAEIFCRHLDGAVVTSQTISPVLAVILQALRRMSLAILNHIKMRQGRKDCCVQKREATVLSSTQLVLFEEKIWKVKQHLETRMKDSTGILYKFVCLNSVGFLV